MDRGALQAIVHGVANSQTQLSNFHSYGKRRVLSKSVKKTGYQYENIKQKNYITDLNLTAKTPKCLGEIIGNHLHNFRLNKIHLIRERKMDKLDILKLKIFCSSKDVTLKMKNKSIQLEKIFSILFVCRLEPLLGFIS